MATSKGPAGYTMPASLLMDPKAMKKHLANGSTSSHSDHFEQPSFSFRQQSEPLQSLHIFPFEFETPLAWPRDDAYQHLEQHKHNKASSAQQGAQVPSSRSEARLLLDPLGHSKGKRDSKTESPPVDSRSPSHFSTISSTLEQPNGNSSHSIHENGIRERGLNDDESDGKGMSSFIERVHNVSQREERPPKKQKIDTFDDDDDTEKKAIHGGGGKGGEIGEYMRQKKKEGLAESGSIGALVDLTGGKDLGSTAEMLSNDGCQEMTTMLS